MEGDHQFVGRIIRYDKAQESSGLKYVEAGVSIFKKEVLDRIKPGRIRSLENDIFPQLIADNQLAAYEVKTRFFDIGTLDRLDYFANSKFKS